MAKGSFQLKGDKGMQGKGGVVDQQLSRDTTMLWIGKKENREGRFIGIVERTSWGKRQKGV